MSEHIQSVPSAHAMPAIAAMEERTLGVMHERQGFNFRLILWVGFGLFLTAAVIHVVVWWLLHRLERTNELPAGSRSSLAEEDAKRTLDQRLQNVPSPHLEGIERESSLLILRLGENEERRFFVAADVRVRIDEKPARLFDLREGQSVSITYHVPGGTAGGTAVATSVTSSPVRAGEKSAEGLPHETQTLTAIIVRVEPRSVAASREWAEAQMDQYGWADREQKIARIPIAAAMEKVLQSKEFRPPKKGEKSDGRLATPTRANSGNSREGGGR